MKQDELTETTIATIDLLERIESVKAGVLGALTAGLMFGAATLANDFLASHVMSLAALRDMNSFLLMSGSIAALSGFLFGITYRYIIRQDQNPHLRSGAVLAFGLVRGFAIIEGRLEESMIVLPLWVVLIAESLLLFAGVRVGLDWALSGGWIRPFGIIKVNTDAAR